MATPDSSVPHEAYGAAPVVNDPTANVIAMLASAVDRIDDLRSMNNHRVDEAIAHIKGTIELRAQHIAELREAESKRIDAIRAVDVGAVNRAAEVSAAQALTLATQVATSAETLRTQVATTAEAQRVALGAALVPLQDSIADLRRVQYEQQGQKTAVTETKIDRRLSAGQLMATVSTAFVALSAMISLAVYLGLHK